MEIVMSALRLMGGVAVFLFGMVQMGKGLEQGAGVRLRRLFKRISRYRVSDYAVGLGATAIVQSSSATSVMVVGLAHAKIVSVRQGAGIMLGAKVGTTVTAFIIALSGVGTGGFSVSAVFGAMAFVGVMAMLTKKGGSSSQAAPFLIGFGQLFIGMEVMKGAVGGEDTLLGAGLAELFRYEIMQSPVLLILLATVVTAFVLHSSSVATGIFIMFLMTGVIGSIDQAFFLAMGANVGTCIDGMLASVGTNVDGKRVAWFHALTSIIGTVAFSVVLWCLRVPIVGWFEGMFPNAPEFSLAAYNLVYNLVYTLVLLVCIDPLVGFVDRIVQDRNGRRTKFQFLNEQFYGEPMVVGKLAVQEVARMARMAVENYRRALEALLMTSTSESRVINTEEDEIDALTENLVRAFTQISARSGSVAPLMSSLHSVAIDLERVGDHAIELLKETAEMQRDGVVLSEETKRDLRSIYRGVQEMIDLSLETFETRKTDHLKMIGVIEEELNRQIARAFRAHFARLADGTYSWELSKPIDAALKSLKRVVAHIVNMAFSEWSATGSKEEAFYRIENERK